METSRSDVWCTFDGLQTGVAVLFAALPVIAEEIQVVTGLLKKLIQQYNYIVVLT